MHVEKNDVWEIQFHRRITDKKVSFNSVQPRVAPLVRI